jgi:hypothetical protein
MFRWCISAIAAGLFFLISLLVGPIIVSQQLLKKQVVVVALAMHPHHDADHHDARIVCVCEWTLSSFYLLKKKTARYSETVVLWRAW